MPAEGLPWLERDEILASRRSRGSWRCWPRWASRRAADRRRAAGAPRLPELVGMLAAAESRTCASRPTASCSSATPRRWSRAGVDRFNVSIDSLQRDRFFEMTRRDALPQVLRGPGGAGALPRGAPDQGQRGRDARLHRGRGAAVRPLRARAPLRGPLHRVHAAGRRPRLDARQRPDRRGDPRGHRRRDPLEPEPREPHATARVYRFADGRGAIGFINPVSEPFCADCNRIRLTAEGQLRTCLFSLNETDLRGPLRAGAGDDELERIIRDAVWRKELKHHVNEPGFIQPARTMSAIGG